MFARPEPSARRRPADRPDLKPWLLLFGVGLGVRLAVTPFVLGEWLSGPAWLGIAGSMARGEGFAWGTTPTADVAPVVPWIASGVLRVGNGSELFVGLALAAIGALAPLLVSAFGSAVFGGSIGRIAGWIAAVDPLLFLAAPTIESVAATTAMIALVSTAAWVKAPRAGRAFGVGLLWGLAALTHPALLALPPLTAAWAWAPLGLTIAPSDRVRQIAIFAAGLLLVVAPWTLRNATSVGAFAPVTSGGMRDLRRANGSTWRVESPFHGRESNEAEHSSTEIGERHSPGPALTRRAVTLLAPGAWGTRSRPWDLAILSASLLLLPLAAWGAARALTGPRRWFQSLTLIPVLVGIAFALAYGGGWAARIPIEPLIAVFAAVGIADLRRRQRARARGFTVIEGSG